MKFLFQSMRYAVLCAALVAAGTMISCSDDDNDNGGDGGGSNPPTPSGDLVLSVDPAMIQVGGEQAALFTVMSNEEDVTDLATLRNVTANVDINGNTFTSADETGIFEFQATYDGKTSNIVSVEVVDYDPSVKYYRRVLGYQFTGAHCGPCISMTQALESASAEYPGRIQVVGVHLNIPMPDPLYNSYCKELAETWDINATPSLIIDYLPNRISQSVAMIKKYVRDRIAITAGCGIALETKVNDSNIEVTANVEFIQSGDYRIFCCLVENGLTVSGGMESVYNDVLRAFTPSANGEDMMGIQAGNKMTKTFTISADSEWKIDNCDVVVFLQKKEVDGDLAGSYTVNNVASCKANGGSVDIRYEE